MNTAHSWYVPSSTFYKQSCTQNQDHPVNSYRLKQTNKLTFAFWHTLKRDLQATLTFCHYLPEPYRGQWGCFQLFTLWNEALTDDLLLQLHLQLWQVLGDGATEMNDGKMRRPFLRAVINIVAFPSRNVYIFILVPERWLLHLPKAAVNLSS